jgi:hypothetical protein
MQTFLPYKDFNKSAQVLDSKRLNKQILEGYQILKVLNNPDPKAAWRNHPAVKMWRGYEHTLFGYILSMVVEADKRGIKTINNKNNIIELRKNTVQNWGQKDPDWYSNENFMKLITTTHKVNLYRKDNIYYEDFQDAAKSKYNKPCCDKCNYFWVTHVLDKKNKINSV